MKVDLDAAWKKFSVGDPLSNVELARMIEAAKTLERHLGFWKKAGMQS